MKKESRKFLLLCAVFFTVICLMYLLTALSQGLYAALARPSLIANALILGFSLTLATLCWCRWLRFKPDREEFHQKKHRPLTCWALAVFCGGFGLVWVVLYFRLGRSLAALAAALFLFLCAAVWIRKAIKARRDNEG